jgi:hypothetical protein
MAQGTFHTTVGGVLVNVVGVGILDAYGETVPTDGATGYAIGCTFRHTDGGDGTALYVNEGTKASADFNAITVA